MDRRIQFLTKILSAETDLSSLFTLATIVLPMPKITRGLRNF